MRNNRTAPDKTGQLWVVATPLGNLGDFSPRAGEILTLADCVLAEDTRRARLFFAACGIKARALMSLHEHNELERLAAILSALAQGKNFALISDAGTPLYSDPGYRLVRACRERGYKVVPVPGPSAPLAALCASGLPPQPSVFLGFLPRKKGDLRVFIQPYARLPATLVFFERKDRLKNSLALLYEFCGERELCIARELTKVFEEFMFFQLRDFAAVPDDLLGELTVLLGPPGDKPRSSAAELLLLLREAGPEAGKPRSLAKKLYARTTGWSVDELYTFILLSRSAIKKDNMDP
ncbi:MAG: 16S rRNA (cytidine(1402)-2'-O)-methyltransferase [Deltaproteobacteria bacterium]|nr:16S rRNA (cytidine(1402)-2'-O)-methyltransferase [Deltaproteobacteria bacterium]